MEVKYDNIGINYNQTRKADKYLTSRFLHHLEPKKDKLNLDIGCGTGNYTNELQKRGFQFIGIDPSTEMLGRAREKNKEIDWRLGTVENTGISNNLVDGIIASLTIHHWDNLKQGFSELNRVLKVNGNVVIFTSTPKQMKGYWLCHYFPQMLSDSILQMPSYETVKSAMLQSGFEITNTEKYFVLPDLEDKFLYCGKHSPELYFDKEIRQGISSFLSLANRGEVEKGLAELREDIDSDKIDKIINSYENDFGDYLFIIGKKVYS
ncbi:class I SAM-dependent methyltransferase [Pontibacter toksunensis]|uniref:Class I SAM-dependent methyltransferase n=1 Tax=Pontibacter toksunensis TaxID=1332631 RepID=A0ABW6C008_9BACT